MLLLDVTVVNVALPAIRADLDASFGEMQWVIDAYALTLAATLLSAGALADRIGRRAVFAWGLALFTACSALCAVASTPVFLDLARAAQGVGAAAMFASSLALLANEFQDSRARLRPRRVGWRHRRRPCHRSPDRRGADRRAGLALDLPRQPADWRPADLADGALAARVARGATASARPRRDGDLRRCLLPRHLRPDPRQRGRLGQPPDHRLSDRRRRTARRLRRDRAPRRGADAAALAVSHPGLHRDRRGRLRAVGRALPAVAVRGDLHAGRARPIPHRDRPANPPPDPRARRRRADLRPPHQPPGRCAFR